jgi:plasmid stabilization system protein ParE
MAKINLSHAAISDLRSIFDYIATDSEFYARKVVDRILQRITILENQIWMGKVVKEFNNNAIREILEGNYRIIYRIESEDELSIIRIYHGARLLKSI